MAKRRSMIGSFPVLRNEVDWQGVEVRNEVSWQGSRYETKWFLAAHSSDHCELIGEKRREEE